MRRITTFLTYGRFDRQNITIRLVCHGGGTMSINTSHVMTLFRFAPSHVLPAGLYCEHWVPANISSYGKRLLPCYPH